MRSLNCRRLRKPTQPCRCVYTLQLRPSTWQCWLYSLTFVGRSALLASGALTLFHLPETWLERRLSFSFTWKFTLVAVFPSLRIGWDGASVTRTILERNRRTAHSNAPQRSCCHFGRAEESRQKYLETKRRRSTASAKRLCREALCCVPLSKQKKPKRCDENESTCEGTL